MISIVKKTSLLALLLAFGCKSTDKVINNSVWNVEWKLDNEHANGKLILMDDHKAQLEVYGSKDSFLLKDSSVINYTWNLDSESFTLTRPDNGVELRYDIVKVKPHQIKLLFANDIMVTLQRTSFASNIYN